MDEEYDVIVLGTGLTVSSQSGLIRACRGTKKKNKQKGKKQGGMRELPCGYNGAASRRRPVILRVFVAGSERLPASQ